MNGPCEANNSARMLTDSSSTQLTLIRHGHIAANGGDLNAPMSGWADIPLSPIGRLQIERLTRYLACAPRFAAIYSSPLSRAAETAQALAGAGLGDVHFHGALKEINCGEVDGVAIAQVQRRFPDLWHENNRQDREDFRWPGGESYREFRERCIAALQSIAATHPSARVALVTHTGVISQIIGSIHGLNPARWEAFRPGNASISELLWRGSSGVILSFDYRGHLTHTT
jgi:2,3-bisphosphoglycerate-dependent phosphoglycerate mutase